MRPRLAAGQGWSGERHTSQAAEVPQRRTAHRIITGRSYDAEGGEGSSSDGSGGWSAACLEPWEARSPR